jgi:hypothetical protein
MKRIFLSALIVTTTLVVSAQSTVYVRNSTWQDFEVEVGQTGTVTVPQGEWSGGDPIVRGWLETTGQEVLSFNRTNTAVPEGDTAYFNIELNGATDFLTIKTRVIGIAGSTEMAYSVEGNGFSEPWFDDGNFHEVQTTLAGKAVVIKFKPDNDDSNSNRDVRFAIHDLPVYEIDAADFENPSVMNAMFYNIQMISFGLSGMPQPNERGALLPAQISEYQDVVCFSEAFDDSPREDHLIPAMAAVGFLYRTEILNPAGIIPIPTNGGIIIFSRWPIETEEDIDYAECGQAAQDCLANKGVKYARINKLGKRYHVFGTHMDAGSQSDDIFARRTQMAEIRDFIADLNIPENEPVIFGGDFNVSPTGDDYLAFLDTINPIIPQHLGFYESNFNDDFGRIIDHAWGVRTHLVPTTITNEIITIRSLNPVLWDLSEFSDHRCILGRYTYPDFTKTGGDTLVCPGENLTLSVNSTFPASYQWLKNGSELNGESNSELELLNTIESESGNYSCIVSYNVIYGDWGDSLTAIFYPDGADTVEAGLNFDFGQITIDDVLCQVGIEDVLAADWLIFPNPTTGILNVSLSERMKDAGIKVYSSSGKLVYSIDLNETDSAIDLSHLSDGLYMVEIAVDGGSVHQRFVMY